MLTNLLWIADGKPFPPEDADENARLAEHAQMRDAYNGLHERIFPAYAAYLADSAKDPKKQKIILDWPSMGTDTYLSLLLGEEPEVLAGDRQDLPERPDEQVFIDVSRYGHGLYEISDSGIKALNPENCHLIVSPDDIQNPWAFVFFRVWEESDQNKKIKYVKFTIHSKGQIQHLVFEVKDGKLSGPRDLALFPVLSGLQVDAQGIQRPTVDDVLVVHVNNRLSSERYYGRSDYKPSILSLIADLEKRFAERSEVLSKFVNPTPVIPESATTFDHATKEWVYKPGKPIIVQPGETSPSLLTWQAELGAVERAIEQEMDQLLQMMQLSKVLLAGKDAGQAESGTALRIRLIPTLSKVSIYARAAEKAIPKVLSLWSQLHPPAIPIEQITVNLQDGIPEDPMETAQAALLWDQMGAISMERKLVLQGFKEGSGAFDKELERLKGAQQAQQQAGPASPAIELPALGKEQNAGQQPAQ